MNFRDEMYSGEDEFGGRTASRYYIHRIFVGKISFPEVRSS